MKLSYRFLEMLHGYIDRGTYTSPMPYDTGDTGPRMLNGIGWKCKYYNVNPNSRNVLVCVNSLPGISNFIGVKFTFKDPGVASLYSHNNRNSTPIILKAILCSSGMFLDKNRAIYYSAPGILFDSNFVPLMWVTKPTDRMSANTSSDEYKRIITIHPYVFKRADIVSRVILDTIVPIFVNTDYKKASIEKEAEIYENPFYNIFSKVQLVIAEPDKDMFIETNDVSPDMNAIKNITKLYIGQYL